MILASLRFFRRILWTPFPTGVVVSDFNCESVIVLVDAEKGKVDTGCFGLIGMLWAICVTMCYFCRLEGRNMLPIL